MTCYETLVKKEGPSEKPDPCVEGSVYATKAILGLIMEQQQKDSIVFSMTKHLHQIVVWNYFSVVLFDKEVDGILIVQFISNKLCIT